MEAKHHIREFVEDLTTLKLVEAMAAVGNDATHGAAVTAEAAERFGRDLGSFVGRFGT